MVSRGLVAPLALSLFAASVQAQDNDLCRPLSDEEAQRLKGRAAVVTDIDGVLSQYFLLDYGPTDGAFLDIGVAYPREDAALMLSIYQRKGYAIVYMAGRPRQMEVLGKSMCEATRDWLYDNGFPIKPGDTLILLRDGDPSVVEAADPGNAMAEWMGDHGTDLFTSFVTTVSAEFGLDPRYGYVDSDVVSDAYIAAGVSPESIFSIGNKGMSRLGYRGTVPITEPHSNAGYRRHIREYVLKQVPGLD